MSLGCPLHREGGDGRCHPPEVLFAPPRALLAPPDPKVSLANAVLSASPDREAREASLGCPAPL